MFIRPLITVALAMSVPTIGAASADQHVAKSTRFRIAQQNRVCPQVIHCGTKDGVVKEYATRCAAEDDGATSIAPKTGPTCPAAQ